MAEGRLILDVVRCVGCFACEVACNQEHELPPGMSWIRVRAPAVESHDGQLRLHQQLHLEAGCTLCQHRVERGLLPACVQHCLARAIRLASDDHP